MWEEIQDMPGEIFDIEQAREDIARERAEREEMSEFLDICFDLFNEGFTDEDAIMDEAHKIMEGN
jgi:hypothetical protein